MAHDALQGALLPPFPGAAPADWDGLIRAGVGQDLLPVALDPDRLIDGNSSLRTRGKIPSRYSRSGETIIGIPAWPAHVATPTQVSGWRADRALGVCVITRTVRAVDVDITDEAEAQAVRNVLRMLTGGLPERRRTNAAKFLAAFRLPGVLQKRIIRTKSGGLIELLATGQQFVAAGIHYSGDKPSGGRYLWDTKDGFAPDSFPEIPLEELDFLWDTLVDAFAAEGTASLSRSGTALPRVTRRAADSKPDDVLDFLVQAGRVIEFDKTGRVDIICPFERLHTTVSNGSATSYFPAGVGGYDRGGFRCLHAHCEHRTTDDFLQEIGYVSAQFDAMDPEPAPSAEEAGSQRTAVAFSGKEGVVVARPPYVRDSKGAIEPVMSNVLTGLRHETECGASLRQDAFDGTVSVRFSGAEWRALRDTDITRFRETLERRKGFKSLAMTELRAATDLVAEENEIDSAIEWAATLKWDGVPRIDGALVRYWGAEDCDYTTACSRYLFTALAARCIAPGSKADMIVVLEGAQGIGKGASLKALAPLENSHVEVSLHTKGADLARLVAGKLIVELSELSGLSKADRETIKAWVTQTNDEWVPKYKERSQIRPRRYVLVGTTNETEYLDDPTGLRRWLPVHVESIDLAALRRDRDQLWAEALQLFAVEGVLWEEANSLAGPARKEREVAGDAWSYDAARWILAELTAMTPEELAEHPGFTFEELWAGVLMRAPGEGARYDPSRLSRALYAIGARRVRTRKGARDGEVRRLWQASVETLKNYLERA